MKKKVVSQTTHILDENYQLLANAICIQAVHDFESLISDRPYVSDRHCNLTEIHQFACKQVFTNVKLDDVLDIVKKNYEKKFRPYIEENGEEIWESWTSMKFERYGKEYKRTHHPYHCPNCGGTLYPKTFKNKITYIFCDGCNLNMRLNKKEKKKCTISA